MQHKNGKQINKAFSLNDAVAKECKHDKSMPLNLTEIGTFMTSSKVPQPLKKELVKKLKKNQVFNTYQKAKINNEGVNSNSRTSFTKEEDEKIKLLVNNIGTRQWPLIATFLEGRTAKQCRDRYANYLMPGFLQGEWSKNEDELLKNLFFQYGSKWSVIHKFMPNRSANSIKNHWNYLCRQRKGNKKIFKLKKNILQTVNRNNELISNVELNDPSNISKNLSDNNSNINIFGENNNEIVSFIEQGNDWFESFNDIEFDKEWMIFN